MFIVKCLSQHVSGTIMPIIRRIRACTTTYGVLHWLCWLWLCGARSWAVCTVWKSNSNFHTVHTAHDPAPHNHSQHNQCGTPYAVVHSLVLLKMGIMMSETCWDRNLIINIRLVASCWFLSSPYNPPCHISSYRVLRIIVIFTFKRYSSSMGEKTLRSYSSFFEVYGTLCLCTLCNPVRTA